MTTTTILHSVISSVGPTLTVNPRFGPKRDDETHFIINRASYPPVGIVVKTTDLFVALDATTNVERDTACASIQQERAAWQKRAEEAEAALTAAKAWFGANQNRDAWADGKQWRAARESLREILDPRPAFSLPTEVGAGIVANNGTEHELRLYSDGLWFAKTITHGYTPEQVMRHFTDHRLIGVTA